MIESWDGRRMLESEALARNSKPSKMKAWSFGGHDGILGDFHLWLDSWTYLNPAPV